jgi:hypothetical protein
MLTDEVQNGIADGIHDVTSSGVVLSLNNTTMLLLV